MKIFVLAFTEAQIQLFLRNCIWRIPGGSTHRVHRIDSIARALGFKADVVYALPRWQESFKDDTRELGFVFHRSGFEIVEVTENQVTGHQPFELVPYQFVEYHRAHQSGKRDQGLYEPNPNDQRKMLAEARALNPIVRCGTDLGAPFVSIILELAKENKRLTDALVAEEQRKNPIRMIEYVPPVAGHRAGSV